MLASLGSSARRSQRNPLPFHQFPSLALYECLSDRHESFINHSRGSSAEVCFYYSLSFASLMLESSRCDDF